MLLLTSETASLRDRLRDGEYPFYFVLTYLDPALFHDFLAFLDMVDHVRRGFLDMVDIVPSAAIWSRSRHSGLPDQTPLCSRSSPLGLFSLNPAETEKTNAANRAMEISAWVAKQTLHCPSKVVGLDMIFPQGLGGHISHGPSSLWALREFQLLEGTRDARRAAGHLCQITGADYKCPIGVLSTCARLRSRMSLEWPLLEKGARQACV